MKSQPSRRLLLLALGGLATLAVPCLGQTLYNFGNPTGEEQLYLELINRARANPGAEGTRLAATTDPDVTSACSFFSVNLAMMKTEFNAIAAQPPLAPNASLTTAARNHSAWMLAKAVQAHNETSPSNTPFTRMTSAGYTYSTAAENVYAFSKSVWHGHAGFQVDWGPGGTGGMQGPPRGHRANIHSSAFREIGLGVSLGTNGEVGPQLVTQDFGTRSPSPTFGTGVAYYDLNANNFYDLGEGISGLTVNVNGASYYCTTAIGGGWVVPVPTSAATRTATFSGLGISQSRSLVVPASTNAKVDLKLAYTPPAVSSPATATAGALHTLAFTGVGGATGYRWNYWNSGAAAAENCNSLANVTVSTTSAYSVLNTSVKQEGSGSFHLANPGAIGNQIVELNSLFHGQTTPSLAFQSRLTYSTADERHSVQVKEEGSTVWQEVHNQNGGTLEASFSLKTVSLSAMAGKRFRVRFILNFPGGSTYGSTEDNSGWFIDAISFSGVSTLTNNVSRSLTGTSGSFTPVAGTYLMSIAPVISNLDFPATYQTLTVTPAPASSPTFATWATNLESTNSLAAGAISNSTADPDKDGRSNLIEYAFGTSPVTGNDPASKMPTAQLTATELVLQYQRDTTLTDLTFTVQACSSMGNWKAPGEAGAPTGFTDTLISTSGSIQTRKATIPRSSGSNCFMRVRVSKL